MKKIHRVQAGIFLLAALLIGIFMIDTAEAAAKKTKVTKVTITNFKANKNYVLKIGQTKKLKVQVLPKKASNKKVKWTSSNKAVATVSSSGVVKGKANGKVTIRATAKDGSKKYASRTFRVGTPVKKVTFTNLKDLKPMPVGTTFTLKKKYSPENATYRTLQWSSSNPKVATVSKGVITAKGKGSATITAVTKDGSNKKVSCKVQVIQLVKSVKISNPTNNSFARKGSQIQMESSVLPATANNKKLQWSSNNPKVATVNSKGVVTCVGKGSARIKAVSQDGTNKYSTYWIQVVDLKAQDALFVAHRGYSAVAPENSMAAYEMAALAGFGVIECDIWVTKDGEFVVSHDESLLRMCGTDVKVTDLTLEEATSYLICSGNGIEHYPEQYIPSLEEVLAFVNTQENLQIQIELKGSFSQKAGTKLYQLLAEYNLLERSSITGFSATNLLRVQSAMKEEIARRETERMQAATDGVEIPEPLTAIRLARLNSLCEADVVEWCIKNQIGLNTKYQYVYEGAVERLHEAGLTVGVYDVEGFFAAFNMVKNLEVDYLTANEIFFTK